MDREEKHTRESEKRTERGGSGRSPGNPDARRRKSADRRKKASASGAQRRGQGKRGADGRGKKHRRRSAFNIGSTVVLIAAVCVFVFSLYQLVTMLVPYYSGGQEYDKIRDLAITVDDTGGETGEDGSGGFSVDFDVLLEENEDTVAWIRFDEPSIINYPVVKSADNSDYLTKTFTANDNKLGAIFVDYRNASDFSDRNTFIYGHHLNVGGEMFSELVEYEDESFCRENPYFYIYTPDGKVRMYTVFSAGVVKDTAENYNITYNSDEDFENYINLCRESSNYQVDVEVNAQSKIVSLSTCTNVRDDERFLVQGVLTSEEPAGQ